jgi:hypothetical protein
MKKIRVRILGFGETSKRPSELQTRLLHSCTNFHCKISCATENNPGNYLPAKLDPKKQAVQRTIF